MKENCNNSLIYRNVKQGGINCSLKMFAPICDMSNSIDTMTEYF